MPEKPLSEFCRQTSLPKPPMKTVHCSSDQSATAADVAQLVARLPYLEAINVASFCSGDVDKIVEGALSYLNEEQGR